MTSTLPVGQRKTPYMGGILSGDKPTVLEEKERRGGGGGGGGGEKREEESLLRGSLAVSGSTSRLDHISPKAGSAMVPPKQSQLEHTTHQVSVSQPALHRTPARTKSEPGLGMNRVQGHARNRKDNTQNGLKDHEESPGISRPAAYAHKSMGRHTSANTIPSLSGRSTPLSPDSHTSGRSTPSRLMHPSSKLSRPVAGKRGAGGSGGGGGKDLLSDESECGRETERSKLQISRQRSNSEARKMNIEGRSSLPRATTSSISDQRELPGNTAGGIKVQQKSSTFSPDSRLTSPDSRLTSPDSRLIGPSSVPTGDGFRQLKEAMEKEGRGGIEGSRGGGGGGGEGRRFVGMRSPDMRKGRTSSSSSTESVSPGVAKVMQIGGREGKEREPTPIHTTAPTKEEGGRGGGEKPSGGLRPPKGSPLQFGRKFGGPHNPTNQKSSLPSSAALRTHSPATQGAPINAHLPTIARREMGERESGRSQSSNNSSLENSLEERRERKVSTTSKLEKPVSIAVSPSQPRVGKQDRVVKPVVDASVDEDSPNSSTEALSLPGDKEGSRYM